MPTAMRLKMAIPPISTRRARPSSAVTPFFVPSSGAGAGSTASPRAAKGPSARPPRELSRPSRFRRGHVEGEQSKRV